MSDEQPKTKQHKTEQHKTEDGQGTRRGAEAPEPKTGDRIIDGRLDPDAQSPDDERSKPFDPSENDPD